MEWLFFYIKNLKKGGEFYANDMSCCNVSNLFLDSLREVLNLKQKIKRRLKLWYLLESLSLLFSIWLEKAVTREC